MTPNVTGLIDQMQTIAQSDQNFEKKATQVDNILTANWGTIITSTGENNAQRLEALGTTFRNAATTITDPGLRGRVESLSNHLNSAAREMRVPNLQMDQDGMMWTPEEMRGIQEMRQNRPPPPDGQKG